VRTIGRLLFDSATRNPSETYLIANDEAYPLADVMRRSNAAAAALRGLGIGRGDRVAMLVRNEPRFLFTWFGAARLGAAIVPLDPGARRDEAGRFLARASPKLVVASDDLVAFSREAAAGVDEHQLPVVSVVEVAHEGAASFVEDAASQDDVALLLPTSGTTAAGKLVMQTHRALVLAGEAFPWWIGLRSSDRSLAALPLFHLNALAYSTLGSLAVGASLVLLPRFSASRFLDQARRYEGTHFNAVGAMLEILMRQPPRRRDADNPLRLCYAAPAPATKQRHLEIEARFGWEITAGYALSETPFGTVWPRGERPYGSLGRLRQHPELGDINEGRVVDDAGREMAVGETGELLLRNPAVMAGYFGMPEETQNAVRAGWLHTGDLVRRDADGIYWFVARRKEIIRRRGENIAPGEIEEALIAHPSVVDAAVAGVPSELGEEDVKAFVVAPDVDLDALVKTLRDCLSKHKVPRYIELVADLPRTATGRVAKHLLPRERNERELDTDRPTAC
jgi:carnitine-CoA ligase